MFEAKVVLDSVNPDGQRLITVAAKYPRYIHSEVLTHRALARNSASSRAIPWKRLKKDVPQAEDHALDDYIPNCMYSMIQTDPVIPLVWGAEQKGMQTGMALEGEKAKQAEQIWLAAMKTAVTFADALAALGVHKSLCNRITEPWMWITTLITATEWKNFFRLRCHPDAEASFQKIAGMIRHEITQSVPQKLMYNHWHLPYIDALERDEITHRHAEASLGVPRELSALDCIKYVSVGRCARVSYLTHEGKRDFKEDIALAWKLINRTDDVIHASPLEHVAQSSHSGMRSGPFRGWFQMRKEFPGENVEG